MIAEQVGFGGWRDTIRTLTIDRKNETRKGIQITKTNIQSQNVASSF
jgi:hypothetical protein